MKKDSTVLYIRNLPTNVADTLREYSRQKRVTMAGVIIELVEFAEASNLLKVKSVKNSRSN